MWNACSTRVFRNKCCKHIPAGWRDLDLWPWKEWLDTLCIKLALITILYCLSPCLNIIWTIRWKFRWTYKMLRQTVKILVKYNNDEWGETRVGRARINYLLSQHFISSALIHSLFRLALYSIVWSVTDFGV